MVCRAELSANVSKAEPGNQFHTNVKACGLQGFSLNYRQIVLGLGFDFRLTINLFVQRIEGIEFPVGDRGADAKLAAVTYSNMGIL